MTAAAAHREGGFTLIEVLVALGLFSIVAIAGVSLLDSILRVENQTRSRLAKMGELQRAVYSLTRDLERAAPGSFRRTRTGILFSPYALSIYDPPTRISYSARGSDLVKITSSGPIAGRPQRLLAGVSAARWTFFHPGRGWSDDPLPVPQAPGNVAIGAAPAPPRPIAVALDLTLTGAPGGRLRRVVEIAPGPEPVLP